MPDDVWRGRQALVLLVVPVGAGLLAAALLGRATVPVGTALAGLAAILGALVAVAWRPLTAALHGAHVRGAMAARERERRWWARELHDGPLQQLAALKLIVSVIRDGEGDPGAGRALADAADLLDEQVNGLRSLVRELRPAGLDGRGLHTALAALADQNRRLHALQVSVEVRLRSAGPGTTRPEAVDEAVYRVVQEALSNVARHAGATIVRVLVVEEAERLQVRISDDGHGFPARMPTEGFGLAGMRERAASLGGRVAVRSLPGAGTTVRLTLPLGGPARGGSPLRVAPPKQPAAVRGPAVLPVVVVDQVMRRARWAGAVFALLQLSITTPAVFAVRSMPAAAAAVALSAVAVNLCLPDSRRLPAALAERLGVVQIVVDAGFVLALVGFNQYADTPVMWVGLVPVVIEAAARLGRRGAVLTWGVVSVAYLAVVAWGTHAYDRPLHLDGQTALVGVLLGVTLLSSHLGTLVVRSPAGTRATAAP